MRYEGKHTFGERFTDEFVKIFGAKRPSHLSALTKPYPNIAFNVQSRLESIVKLLAKNLHKKNNFWYLFDWANTKKYYNKRNYIMHYLPKNYRN